ncbi:hypothetical protein Ql52_gp002 [Caulobacter phage Quill_5.2]|uniref:Uncharacterized protein n=1 Tax=Caulobacter phage Quill_5.2 TaxID=3075108 RepID=A0AA96PTU4_9CAUD|nr:hypothetical protein Ql52_gp002 [Caulobacter phage Quill_5.2]
MYYVLCIRAGKAWVLTPEGPMSKARAQSAITWQGRPDADTKWVIATYDSAKQAFHDTASSQTWALSELDRGPYTVTYWEHWLEKIRHG